MTDQTLHATVLGYPRIGRDRELKRLSEDYWAGRIDDAAFAGGALELRLATWRRLDAAGLTSVPSNTFSAYDQVLDATVMLSAIPARFGAGASGSDLATYFRMARGEGDVAPFEMTKWFDTNYHYLVPEIGPATTIRADARKPVSELREAAAIGIATRPVLLGPVSYLLLAKAADDAPEGYQPLDRLDDVVAAYETILGALAAAGAKWVQLDEPAFVADRDLARAGVEREALASAYRRLCAVPGRPKLFLASYFGGLGDALPVLAASEVEAIGLDLVSAPDLSALAIAAGLRTKTVVAGVVDGHNVWRTDLDAALAQLATVLGLAGEVGVATSCSLLHVPHDSERESTLDDRVRSWLAFADQKVAEVVLLSRALRDGRDSVQRELEAARAVIADRASADGVRDDTLRARVTRTAMHGTARGSAADRAAAQQERLRLPALPTTTIGSFPQTKEIRAARSGYLRGTVDEQAYVTQMRAEIARVVAQQEAIGLDVLVHGEPERNDMVQYFAENLDGFVTTTHGWVQSYGSRCVRPPILWGDVSRPAPITVDWARYAQGLTAKPVKGMLTGPTTIIAWSFVRDDQPLADTAAQLALAIRDEVVDLEAAGIGVIQVDEPALRELLPLREADRKSYLDWAVAAFRLATSGVADQTQIHTHLCYSEFGEILPAIDALDADVTSIEAARSRMELVGDLAHSNFDRDIGPGVYDIHSPRVPSSAEVEELIEAALTSVPAERLWVNPDCGLKTRADEQVDPALRALVQAARSVRERQALNR